MRVLAMGVLYKALVSVAALILIAAAGVCTWLFVYTGDLPKFENLSQFAPIAESTAVDSCLTSLAIAVPFDQIGKPLRDALAAAEEPIGSAAGLPCASLSDRITSTLMCNQALPMWKYHVNSFRLSWHIRRRFSEQQLFTIYANRAYFGPGAIGVERASRQFFNKEPNALAVEEAALIAGLLRAPAHFSPYKYPENALHWRNQVLEAMAAQGKLDASEAARAEATPLGIEISKVSQTLIGKQITLRGKFSLSGKTGAYVVLGNQQVVYLEPQGSFRWGKPYSEMEGKLVAATGTLRFYHEPPAKPTERAVQRVPDHFYFEAETAQLRLISR